MEDEIVEEMKIMVEVSRCHGTIPIIIVGKSAILLHEYCLQIPKTEKNNNKKSSMLM